MPNILDTVQISGSSYDLKDKNAPSVSAVTQQEYDNLPSSAKTSNTFFVISDAQAGDLSQYWTSAQTNSAITQATSGKVDTTTYNTYTAATDTALDGKQATLVSGTNIKTINNESILGSGNIYIQGGGGKAIEAGRGISITTGETADTVSFSLPISANTNNSVVMGGKISSSFTNNGRDCLMVGSQLTGNNGSDCSLVVGYKSSVNGDGSAVIGWDSRSTGDSAFAFGTYVRAKTHYSFATGYGTVTNNQYEHASGLYNVSNTGSTYADKTIFSVGNGTADNARHNAFEIRQNGDIYLTKDGQDVKLQDQLGGGGSITIDPSLDSGSTNAVANSAITNAINTKLDKPNLVYFTGDRYSANLLGYKDETQVYNWGLIWQSDGSIGFDGSGNLAVFGKLDTSAITTSITSSSTDAQVPSAKAVNDKLGGLKLVKLTQSEYDALATKDNSTLYVIVN